MATFYIEETNLYLYIHFCLIFFLTLTYSILCTDLYLAIKSALQIEILHTDI